METFQLAEITSYASSTDPAAWTLSDDNKFLFDALQGTPRDTDITVKVLRREGVDGHAIKQLGEIGKPFKLTGMIYFESMEDYPDFLLLYKKLIGAPKGTQIWQSSVISGPYDVIGVEVGQNRAVGVTPQSLVANPVWQTFYQFTMVKRVLGAV